MSTGIPDFLILVLGRGRRRWSFVKVMMSTLVSREQSRWWCFDAVEQIYKVFSNKAECYKCSQIPHHCCINGKMGRSLEQNPMLFWKKNIKKKIELQFVFKACHYWSHLQRVSFVVALSKDKRAKTTTHNSWLKQAHSHLSSGNETNLPFYKRPRRCDAK